MFIVDSAIVLATLAIVVRVARTIYIDYGHARFNTTLPARDVVVLLAVLTASAAVRVWRDPDTTSGWLLLAFNACAFPTAMIVAQRRRRRQAALSVE